MKKGGLTRRDFLKGTVAGATLMAAGGVLGACNMKEEGAKSTAAAQERTTMADETTTAGSGEAATAAPETPAGTSGGYAWEQKMVPITDFVDEKEFDIVIIGAGMAGCAAAQSAAEAGASVCVVEKSSKFTAHGTDVCAIGSKLQKELNIEIDKAEAARLIYDWSQQQANYALIRTFVEKSGEVMDYYIDMARENNLEVHLNNQMTARSDWDTLADRYKQFRTAHKFAPLEMSMRDDGEWVTANLIEMNKDDAEKNGAEFLFNTKAEQLIREGDKVTGVVVSDEDGYTKITAKKGVILATGGIGGSEEMKRCWCPIALRADLDSYTPAGFNTGDGIVMGMQIGAARSNCYPAPIIHPVNLAVMGPGFDTTWLTVNRDGQRYCNEMGYEPIVTNARMMTPGNISWAIMDANYKEHALHQEPTKAQAFVDGLEEAMEAAVQDGSYVKADTLDELAGAIGVPADALKATVERYNKWCDAGEDKDFQVPERFLSSVKDAPFYACKVNAWLLALPYGLHVDENSQVCDDEDNPIGGLFAIGNVQGDFFANSYPVACPGTSHGRGLVFGRLVGQALANDTVIGSYDVVMNS